MGRVYGYFLSEKPRAVRTSYFYLLDRVGAEKKLKEEDLEVEEEEREVLHKEYGQYASLGLEAYDDLLDLFSAIFSLDKRELEAIIAWHILAGIYKMGAKWRKRIGQWLKGKDLRLSRPWKVLYRDLLRAVIATYDAREVIAEAVFQAIENIHVQKRLWSMGAELEVGTGFAYTIGIFYGEKGKAEKRKEEARGGARGYSFYYSKATVLGGYHGYSTYHSRGVFGTNTHKRSFLLFVRVSIREV